MKTIKMPVIELDGTAYDRGHFYGETAKPLIASIVELWKAELGLYGSNKSAENSIDPSSYLSEFLSETSHLEALHQWVPDLLQEIEGISEGSGQDFNTILGLQLLDEEWMYGMNTRLSRSADKCTAFAVADKASFAGQNMDIGSWVDGKQVLLRLMPTETSPEVLLFSVAGNTGLNGINAKGVGVTCNTLAQLNYSSNGLPVSAVVRLLLGMESIDKAEQLLRRVPHASGQNYILSSAGDIRCFECSANSVVRYIPEACQSRIFHTNHPLVNLDESIFLEPEKKLSKSTVARLDSICSRLGDDSIALTLVDIKVALAAHDDPDNPVSRNTNKEDSPIGFTAGSSIYEFSDAPRLHLAAGPPCETDFELFEFKTS